MSSISSFPFMAHEASIPLSSMQRCYASAIFNKNTVINIKGVYQDGEFGQT